MSRIYLSPPHMSGREQQYVQAAFESNWIAPVGPNLNAFEEAVCAATGAKAALAVSSGTAALHLACLLLGLEPGDQVLVSTLTFIASVNPILYCGAEPLFVDSEPDSWNIDPNLVEHAIKEMDKKGKRPKAIMAVDLFGMPASYDALTTLSAHYEIPLIEDAAEALGAMYKGKMCGTFGTAGVFSFNGNKILTTSGGGMLVSDSVDLITRARKLATQAREPVPHFEHQQIGYNYRMSNVTAGIGRGQMEVLSERVAARRHIFERYQKLLAGLPGVEFMPELSGGCGNRWLTAITLDPDRTGVTPDVLRLALEAENIEARPVWKPMHQQPVFKDRPAVLSGVADRLFATGLCLPSGSALSDPQLERIATIIRAQF